MLFLFLVDVREHIACPNPADAGVFVVFISGWKFSACASSFVASVERHLHSAAAGRRPVHDHEICQRSQRGVVFPGSEDPCCSCSFSTHGGTSTALIPPTLMDSGTGGRRLRVSVRKCRRIRSQLRKSDARTVMYRPTKPDHLWFQKKRRRRSCCPVLLCSSPSTRDVGVVTFSPHMKMGYCSSPVQRDDYSVVMSS